MPLHPHLIDVHVPRDPVGSVLVLHGGARRGDALMVSPAQLSVLRMIPIARRIVRAGRGSLAVFRLLNSARGWDASHTPAADARWALHEIERRIGPRPSCLVGHSLGGRGAVLAAGHPSVRSVVALAPWVYPSDVPDRMNAKRILIVHGSRDRVASPQRSAALARNLGRVARVGYVTVEGARHAMLHRHGVFSALAAEFAAATLLGRTGNRIVSRLDAGEQWIVL